MEIASRWVPAEPEALRWLQAVAVDGGVTGYDVGPMPDRAFVLHPLEERLGGRPIEEGLPWVTDEHGLVFLLDDGTVAWPKTRTVRWDSYARRKGVPMLKRDRWPCISNAPAGLLEDDYVDAPSEGGIDDPGTRDALLRILLEHTAQGADAMCTAFYFEFWLLGHPERGIPRQPNVLRGPLGAAIEVFDRPGYVNSPQNLWPDDQSWVLYTDEDAWATAISGSTDLIEDILASPDLESLRLPEIK